MARKLPCLLALCLGISLHAVPAHAVPTGPVKAVLDNFLGTWQGDLEITSADGKKTAQTWRNTFAWTLNGAFLKDEGGDTKGSTSFLGLWSYDPAGKRYQSWYFLGPDGMVANLGYVWDEKARILTGKADLGGGTTVVTVDRFLDKDHYEWSTTIKDKEGKLIQGITAKQTRVK
jgi:hypothetical protein